MKASHIVLFSLLATNVAGAATITISNTADSGAGSLRDALASAADGDTIDATGVSGTILLTTGELLVSNSVTILGPGPANLAVDGNAASRVFHVGPGTAVTICGWTIINGTATGSFPTNAGGGIYNDGAALTISNCNLSDNSANSGGGIFNNGGYGSATLEIDNCSVSGNFVGEFGGGGGIDNYALLGTATLVISNSIISGNSAGYEAGGIDTYGFGGISTVTVINSTISSNSVIRYYGGGGIYNDGSTGSALLQIVNSTLSDNQAPGNGGAIINDGSDDGDATVQAVGSTISGNSSGGRGGAIFNYGYYGNALVTVANSTFSGNSGVIGGGIFSYGEGGSATLKIGSTLLNAGALGVNLTNGFGTVASLGYNLSSDNGAGFLNQPTDILNTNPMLGPLQDNGGPTFTHALLPGSPAIDRGLNFSGSATDQRGTGYVRTYDNPSIPNAPGGDGTDIGAFEVQPPPCSTIVTTITDNGPGSLRAALACAQDGDTIDATGVSGTILLTGGELLVNKSVTILGPGPANLAVDGNAAGRGFNIAPSNFVIIAGLTITNCSYGGFGGGIYNDHAALTISNCAIRGNSGGLGGAIDNNGRSSGRAILTIFNSVISHNTATAAGGIHNDGEDDGSATLTIANSVLDSNSAFDAGGILNNSGIAKVFNSTLSSNSGTGGGGFLNNGTAMLINITLSDNSAGNEGGGGIYNNSTLTLINSTLSGNSADNFGGGIFNDGNVQIGSTVINASSSASTINSFSPGTVTSLGYNLCSDNGGGFLTNPTDRINTDPMLGPLQDNGGPTFTHALLCGSPAIDHGFNFSGSTNDQRGVGFTRTFDDPLVPNASGSDGTDVGAYEVQPGACTPLDSDGDGIPDAIDQCPDTLPSAVVNANGCSIDQLVPCDGPASGGTWKNHGQYVRSVVRTANAFLKASLITRKQWAQIVTGAAHSKCGWNRHSDHDGDRDWHRNWDCSHDADWNRDSSRD